MSPGTSIVREAVRSYQRGPLAVSCVNCVSPDIMLAICIKAL